MDSAAALLNEIMRQLSNHNQSKKVSNIESQYEYFPVDIDVCIVIKVHLFGH